MWAWKLKIVNVSTGEKKKQAAVFSGKVTVSGGSNVLWTDYRILGAFLSRNYVLEDR